MDFPIAAPLAVIGFVALVCVVCIWGLSRYTGVYLRVALYFVMLLLYMVGYFAVFVALGIDRWDDSSGWYWDTWLLFVSMAALATGYARTRFRGALRTWFAAIPLVVLVALILFYGSSSGWVF